MSETYEIRKDLPIPESRLRRTGLSDTIRRMECGDSITVPARQRLGVHACARSVGAKVKTRSNRDGTVTVWRIDQPLKVEGNIFGEASEAGEASIDSEAGADPAGDIFK